MRSVTALGLGVAAVLASAHLVAQAPARTAPPRPVISPEVTADRMVTFRLRAPDAKRVTVIVSEIMRQVPGSAAKVQ